MENLHQVVASWATAVEPPFGGLTATQIPIIKGER